MIDSARWRRSRHSGGGNDCVEVAHDGGATLIRDSKLPREGVLVVPESGWYGLLAALKWDPAVGS
ncbi:protein of unknown function [Haloechinothrix alba]|uniref:DUF397 domain-containing protein n=1 Tax=Haloechinothrix alba TaxID=664784 RepID=A0A238VNR7_9PSEU|nr:DUF397 domain-containing protein [Haloechinothrix alba]SNR35876.1 protein of unknown function [Haloechinothrix alba]